MHLKSGLLAFAIGLFVPLVSMAQNQGENAAASLAAAPWGSEYSFHVGSLLPNQIDGIGEIQPFVGGRYAFALKYGSVELDVANSHARGADYSLFSASYRGELAPVPDMSTLFYIGPDFHYFRPSTQTGRNTDTGFHVGSAIMMHLGGPFWLRADMKFNMKPGTALYIGFGFAVRTAGEGGGE